MKIQVIQLFWNFRNIYKHYIYYHFTIIYAALNCKIILLQIQLVNLFSDSVPIHVKTKLIEGKYTRATAALKQKLEKVTDVRIPDDVNDQRFLDNTRKAKK